jgi:hypothetical protein
MPDTDTVIVVVAAIAIAYALGIDLGQIAIDWLTQNLVDSWSFW